ncbi:hypothetical protein ACIQ8D_06215 [Streptomyces sp. NPDC096094]|uniref:hypothetical protein n=1 Tax=Streptomyces sp. NPDC096094 TaxID=3366073 RepID=UPI0037F8480E
MMLAIVVTSMLAGRVVHQVPRYRYLFAVPLGVAALALVPLTLVEPDTGVWLPVLSIVLVGAGLGTVLPLTTLVMQSALPVEQMGGGTSQIQFWRMLGGPVALAVLGAVMAARLSGNPAEGRVRRRWPMLCTQCSGSPPSSGSGRVGVPGVAGGSAAERPAAAQALRRRRFPFGGQVHMTWLQLPWQHARRRTP